MIHSDDIKAAALNLFAYKGYASTSMQDIAEAVGIKKATIYSHFESKHSIFLALLQEQSDLFIGTISDALAKAKGTQIKDILYEVFEANVKLYNDKTNLLFWKRTGMLAAGYSDANIRVQLRLIMDGFNSQIQEAVQQAIMQKGWDLQPQRLGKYMFTFMLFLHGYLEWMLLSETYEAMDTRAVWEDFWHGME